jgi:hypothetical protein
VNVIEVLVLDRSEVAALPPTVTEVTPLRFVPETVTVSPPAMRPELGVTVEIVGSGNP